MYTEWPGWVYNVQWLSWPGIQCTLGGLTSYTVYSEWPAQVYCVQWVVWLGIQCTVGGLTRYTMYSGWPDQLYCVQCLETNESNTLCFVQEGLHGYVQRVAWVMLQAMLIH